MQPDLRLEQTKLVPDASVLDQDADGVEDTDDNCPGVPNPDQHDEDQDAIGDSCDNCPLNANAEQADEGDGDRIGDICDPNPEAAGDCLLVLDRVMGSASFDTHWLQLSAAPPELEFRSDSLRIVTAPGDTLGLMLRPSAFDVARATAVQVVGRALIGKMSAVSIAVHSQDLQTGFFCKIDHPADTSRELEVGFGTVTGGTVFMSAPINTELSLRFKTAIESGATGYTCHADHGIASNSVGYYTTGTAPTGAPSIRLTNLETEISGIALYEVRPEGCEPPYVW